MLRSILVQLAIQDGRVFNRLSAIYNDQQNRKGPSDPVVWQEVLLMALECDLAQSKCWIVIDGLDECSDHDNLVKYIDQLTSTGPLHRWLFASQPAALVDLKHDYILSVIEIRKSTVDLDIRMYVNARLDDDIRLRRLSDEKKSTIKQALADKSDGMFRWVQCQLDTLCELRDHRLSTIRKVLYTLPETLSKTYQNVLSRIPLNEDRETVIKILQFIALSARPVNVKELAEYAVIDEDRTSLPCRERFEDFESIVSLCGSLISLRDNYVLLAHKSVKEFLTSEGLTQVLDRAVPSEQTIHRMIFNVSLAYMQLPTSTTGGTMDAGVISNYGRLEEVKTKYPFLDYACSMWPLHLAMAGPLTFEEEVGLSFDLTLDGRDNLWTAWLCLQRADIWDRQVFLAVYLCESIILLPQYSSWSTGFWKQRQLHRATRKPIASSADTDAPSHDRDSVLVKYSLSPISFDPASQFSHPVCYHIALVLLEIALQQSLYKLSVTDYSLENHLTFLKKLSREAENRMGQAYAKAIEAALDLCLEIQGMRGDVDWLVKQANERVIEPLRLTSTVGFRASLSGGSTQRSHNQAPTGLGRSTYTPGPISNKLSDMEWLYDNRRAATTSNTPSFSVLTSNDRWTNAYHAAPPPIPSVKVTDTLTGQSAHAALATRLAVPDEQTFLPRRAFHSTTSPFDSLREERVQTPRESQFWPRSHSPPMKPPLLNYDTEKDQEVPLRDGPKPKSSSRAPVWSGVEVSRYIKDRKHGIPAYLPYQNLLQVLDQRKILFLIDDSIHMKPQWPSVLSIFMNVAYLVKEFAFDGLHVCFTSHRPGYTSRDTSTLLAKLQGKRLEGVHDVSKGLSLVLQEYQSELRTQVRRSKSRWPAATRRKTAPPLSLYIFTTGVWSDASDVAKPIKGLINHLEELQLGLSQARIQFITFSGHTAEYDELEHALSDARYLVDIEPSSNNVFKMLVGSMHPGFSNA